MKFDFDWPSGFWRVWTTTYDGRQRLTYPISSPKWAFGACKLKISNDQELTVRSHILPSKPKGKEINSFMENGLQKVRTENRMNSSFPDRWPFSYLNFAKNWVMIKLSRDQFASICMEEYLELSWKGFQFVYTIVSPKCVVTKRASCSK